MIIENVRLFVEAMRVLVEAVRLILDAVIKILCTCGLHTTLNRFMPIFIIYLFYRAI